MPDPKTDSLLMWTLRLAVGLCLLGWAWDHLYWEGPYGILLWREETFSWAAARGIDWETFVGTGANDGLVQRWMEWIGWVYLLGGVAAFIVRPKTWIPLILLAVTAVLLVLLAYAKYVSAQGQLPMFIEYGGQMLSPVVLILAVTLGVKHRATIITAVVSVIMTFAGHGCYAIGWWPTPGHFYGMISLTLGVEYETAKVILWSAGVLDFVVCAGLLNPAWRRAAALYAVAWGLLTALARPVAGMGWDLNYWGADQFLHETAVRTPHFLIPLFLYLVWRVDQPETGDSVSLDTADIKSE